MTIDPTKVSFSQAQGYESLPQQLKPRELSYKARIGFSCARFLRQSGVQFLRIGASRENLQ